LNARQRRVVRRATRRALNRVVNRVDERERRGGRWTLTPHEWVTQAEVHWGRIVEVAVRPRRDSDSDRPARRPDRLRRAVRLALDRVLVGWVHWSGRDAVILDQITVDGLNLMVSPGSLTMFQSTGSGMSFHRPVPFTKQIQVDVYALPTACGPVEIQMAAVVRAPSSTGDLLCGGALEKLDPGATGTLGSAAVFGDGLLVRINFDWQPVEPWDRRLSRYLTLFPEERP